MAPRVSLFVRGLPPGLSSQDYSNLLHEAMATKGVTLGSPGLWLGKGPDWAVDCGAKPKFFCLFVHHLKPKLSSHSRPADAAFTVGLPFPPFVS